jgi:hypothetical protein
VCCLLEELLLDELRLQDDLGFVVDGFPRTATHARALIMCRCTFSLASCTSAVGSGRDQQLQLRVNMQATGVQGLCMCAAG